jgi:hypothetical protein
VRAEGREGSGGLNEERKEERARAEAE